MSWTQEVQSFPAVPIDELYNNAKKWAEKGEWKKQKDLAIKKAVSIVTCMVRYSSHVTAGDSMAPGPFITIMYSVNVASLLHSSIGSAASGIPVCLTQRLSYRTAACCRTGSLVWTWAMLSTSAMLEVCLEPPLLSPAMHGILRPSAQRSANPYASNIRALASQQMLCG